MAALLTYEMGNSDNVVEYISDSKEMGIEVLGPDVNESFSDFTVVYEKSHGRKDSNEVIRFGLAAVKGVGEKAVASIVEARERVDRFKSLYHFCESVDLRAVNKQVLDALIKAGAFDNLGGSRAQMTAGLEKAMQMGASVQSDIQKGQNSLFGADADNYEEDHQQLPAAPPWTEMQMLTYEKEVLGFYVTSNPLSRHAEEINAYSSVNSKGLIEKSQDAEIVIGGMVSKIRYMVTKKGKNAGAKMAVFTLEDLQGSCEVVMFPRILAKWDEQLKVDKIIFVCGKVDRKREMPNILCDELVDIEDASEKLAAKVLILMTAEEVTEEKVSSIKDICSRYAGKSPVYVSMAMGKGIRVTAVADKKLSVRADVDFRKKLEALVGPGKVQLRRK